MKLIIFEGISGSGKTTLFHPVHKLSNYQDLQIHRFTPTNWVYDRLEGRREVDYEESNKKLQELFEVYVIWCDCSSITANKRQIEKKDSMIEDLARARMLFKEYFEKVTSFKQVIYLLTDSLIIEECIDIVKEKIYE
tara:strand:- start:1726 stop:2136 length:411 start_codon:yes stop_codon:yes gene_type:complete